MRARAFTLIEVMIVAMIFSIVAAIAVPSIVSMVRANASREVVARVESELASVRDRARGRDACFRFAPTPAFPSTGPYVLSVGTVACAGETPLDGQPVAVSAAAIGPKLKQLQMRTFVNGAPDATITSITFDRDGALSSPRTAVRFDLLVDDTKRAFLLYPAAGTIEEVAP
jgi:prepilin-type N-terminal cleavage/methylation domain-containing protein